MRTRVKVCCIASLDEARLAMELGADALGLVGRMPSGPGPIPDARIAEIAAWVPPPLASFLLTSETSAEGIIDHVRATGASTVQIVSPISPEVSAQLAARLPAIRRVQVIHVEGPEALDLIPRHAPHVHAFLLDSGRPGAKVAEFGGTGRTHDWDISAAFVAASPRPVFLAGGLKPDNVEEAITRVRPHGVDLCTGVRVDRRLDRDKLRAFMAAVARADGRKETEA